MTPKETLSNIGLRFMFVGLASLAAGLLFGVAGAFRFLYPEFMAELAFYKLRPLHVSLAIAWIFLTAIGGIYYHLANFSKLSLFSARVAGRHFWISLITGVAIICAYIFGKFGGREYWEFPPAFALPILLSWFMFGVIYFTTIAERQANWPVYYWMWGTGIVFFFITFLESYLWLFPFFRESMLREIAVQWKSFGSMVGSWNMLVYGTAIYLMEKISDNESVSRSRMAFGLYFVGLFNLMFGWAHHAYPIPISAWVRDFAYFVSMTELFVLGKIIWDWRSSLSNCVKYRRRLPFRFLFASESWVFANLVLAILISVPAFNLFVHGTHVIVAHAMGATIGINTMIMLALIIFVLEKHGSRGGEVAKTRAVGVGFWLTNGSLVIFLGALVAAGLTKGAYVGASFQEMMENIEPFLRVFAVSGVGLMLGLWLILLPALGRLGAMIFRYP